MTRLTLLLVAVLVSIPSITHADPHAIAAVTSTHDGLAKRLRAAADDQFVAANFEAALAGYRRALEHRDDPKLHFSIGLCQLELRNWAAAADAFEVALAFAGGLTERERTEARDYLARSIPRTATLLVENHQGATLYVDGKPVTAPTVRVLPGTHVVLAKRGDLSATETVQVAAAETRHVTPVIREVHVRTRWAKWKPWVVVGLGAGVGLGSLPLYHRQSERIAEAKQLAEGCIGCDLADRHDALLADADRSGRYGTLALAAGATLAVTGLVLVALNRPTQELRALPSISASGDGVSLGLTAAW